MRWFLTFPSHPSPVTGSGDDQQDGRVSEDMIEQTFPEEMDTHTCVYLVTIGFIAC